MKIRATYIGTATVLLEIGGLRILTDPVLDPIGKEYAFSFGTRSTHVQQPALPNDVLPAIDLVLLSHDEHADNLDDAGRELLRHTPRVLTKRAGARRIGAPARGLLPWESTDVQTPDGFTIRITATPARHGPLFSLPFVGPVIGFILEWSGQKHGGLYVSGDTVWFGKLRDIGKRFRVGTAFLHMGAARFGITGPARFTCDAADACRLFETLGARTLIPIHYEGWTHFKEQKKTAENEFARAGITSRVLWLPAGLNRDLET